MLGFKLTATGEFMDTQGVTISYTLKSPVFRDDDNDGSFIFNTTIPATDKNKRICKFPVRIEAYREMTVEEPIQVYFNGLIIWEGTMIAKFARPEEIEVSIGLGRGEFNHAAKGKKLCDVVPDEEIIAGHYTGNGPEITELDGVVTKQYPETNYALFPVKVNGLCESIGKAFKDKYDSFGTINDYDVVDHEFSTQVPFSQNVDNVPGEAVWVSNYNLFCPFLYNNHVLKSVFQTLGFVLENNPLQQDSDLNKLVVFNNQTINTKRFLKKPLSSTATLIDGFTWPPIYQNVNLLFGYLYVHSLMPNPKFNLKDHVPDILVKDYIRSLENLLFFRVFVDNKTRTVRIKFLKDIVLSNEHEDITDRVLKISERRMEYEKIGLLQQTYDTNDGIGGSLKTIDEFDRLNDVIYSINIPDASTIFENKIIRTECDDRFFLCDTDPNSFTASAAWNFYCYGYFMNKVISSNYPKEWKTNSSGIVTDIFVSERGNYSIKWKLPVVQMDMKYYSAYRSDNNKCDLRFLFYRGLIPGLKKLKPEIKIMKLINPGDYTTDGNPDFQNSAAYTFLLNNLPQNANNVADYIMNNLLSNTWDFNVARAYIISQIGFTDYSTFYSNWCTFSFILNEDPSSLIISHPLYPFASHDVYDLEGIKIPEANLSLKWDGQYGIYERFAKEFITWFNTIAKPVTILMQPSVEDLFTDFSMKKRINGVDYLIDEIRGEITGDKLSVAEVDAWSC